MAASALRVANIVLNAAGGAVALAVTVRWLWRGRRDPLRGSPLRPNRLGAMQVWVCLGAYVVGAWLGVFAENLVFPETPEALKPWRGVLASNIAELVVAVACLAVARAAFVQGWRGLFGLIGWRRVLWLSAGGLLSAIAVCSGIVWVTARVIRLLWPGFQPPEHTVFQALGDPTVPLWLRVIAVAGAFCLAPAAEELLFRGILQSALKRLVPPRAGSMRHRWIAIVIAAAAFGAMHTNTPQYIPALIVLGVILGFLYERSGSLLVPILVHMLFNGRSLLWYEGQNWHTAAALFTM